MTWSLLFEGTLEQAEKAATWVESVLKDRPGWYPVVQVVAELTDNAVRHTRSGEPDGWFVVHLTHFGDRIRVRVYDQGHPTNTPQPVSAHGLARVTQLTNVWGVEGGASGRTLWADIPTG